MALSLFKNTATIQAASDNASARLAAMTPEERAASIAKTAASDKARAEAERKKSGGGITGALKRTFTQNPIDTAKQVAQATQKDLSRATTALHTEALSDVFSMTGKNGLLTNPKGYGQSVKNGVVTDIQTGARVMGEFGSGKWGDLAREAGGDLATSVGASAKTVQKASSFGGKAGAAYETADKYAAVAQGVYEGAESGDYRAALKSAEGAGGKIGAMAGQAGGVYDVAENTAAAVTQIAGQGYQALENLQGGIAGMSISPEGFIGKESGYLGATGGQILSVTQGMALAPRAELGFGGGLGPDTARASVSAARSQAVDGARGDPSQPLTPSQYPNQKSPWEQIFDLLKQIFGG